MLRGVKQRATGGGLAGRAASIAILGWVLAAGCVSTASPRPVPIGGHPVPSASGPASASGTPVSRDGDFAPRIGSLAVWDALAFKPGTSTLAGTEVVKVVVDRTDGATYFLQSERWPIHYFFARRFLSTAEHPVSDEGSFNKREYHQPDRRFVLGTLSRYPGEVWAFELYAGDELDLDTTAKTFEALKRAVFFGDKLRYRPVPLAHETDPRTASLMPIVTTHELFGHVKYQALELGEAFGFVRIFRKGETIDASKLRPFDIVVLAALPEDLPVVSAVVSDELQAPLGHINVLCHNRKTPNMSARDASKRPDILALENKLAKLSVTPGGFTIAPATQEAAEKAWAAIRPKQEMKPPRDDRDVGLPKLADLDLKDIPRVGAKAAQLGLVTRLSQGRFRVPKGFALPMNAYQRFLASGGFDKRIAAMLADKRFHEDPEARRKMLDELRAAMEAAPVPASIVDPLVKRMTELLPPGKVRLRSSTNAEDLPGFNGAGLYRSTRVDPKNRADVENGLRKVWSSVWLWGAHEERSWYRIDSSTVGMAILVQESVDDDVINGVAVTENPFSQGQPGHFVNAQLSANDGSVTGARGNEVPEQVLIYTYEDGRGVERLSLSSRGGGKPILSPADLKSLGDALTAIHVGFTGDSYGMSGRAVDVEFLLAGPSRQVVVVQARPFEVVWTKDRRWLDDDGRPMLPGAR